MKRLTRAAAVIAASVLALSACGDDDDDGGAGPTGATQGPVVVGSFDFPESELLGEIYTQALAAAGIDATHQPRIGNREILFGQVESGAVTVVPEYNGNLLIFVDSAATATSQSEVDAALVDALPEGLEVLGSAAAEDKDSLTVTRETADQHGLTTMADLAPVAGEFVVAGPPEFEGRWAETFQDVYGLQFSEWRSFDVAGPLTVAALQDGTVQVANLFTTDPAIVNNDFVVLEDPESVFPAQNVTPLINSEGLGQEGRDVLNAVSEALDTATLAELVKRIVTDLEDADEVAADWLSSAGLV